MRHIEVMKLTVVVVLVWFVLPVVYYSIALQVRFNLGLYLRKMIIDPSRGSAGPGAIVTLLAEPVTFFFIHAMVNSWVLTLCILLKCKIQPG